MRRRGWGGDPPESDEDARARIIEAAAAVVRDHGSDADVMLVAERLGVTRQTIYRYFPTGGHVFGTLALQAVDEYLAQLRAHLDEWDDPLERLCRALLFGVTRLPEDPRLGVLVKPEIATRLLLSDDAVEGIGPALALVDAGPALPPDESAHVARLVHSLFVTALLAESSLPDDQQLAFYRYVLGPFFERGTSADISR